MLGCKTKSVAGSGPAAIATESANTKVGGLASGVLQPGSEPANMDQLPPSRHVKVVAAYARVSSERQEKEQTIASQLDALTQAAQQRGYQLPPDLLFVDDGYSGARLDRPALDRLRDLVSEGGCEAVLVYSPDRLARNYAYQVVVLEELQRAGCAVLFLNHAFGQSPEEQMLLQIQGVFAEYERALIGERTRRGKLFAARQGHPNWGGCATYGYRIMRKTETAPQHLLIEESEAAVVQQIYRWLVEEQLSSHAIQKRLTEQQVPTRGQNTQGWCQSTVIEILRNPIYKGEAIYNRYQAGDAHRPRMKRGHKDQPPGNLRSRQERPADEWITVPVPALVDPELWRLAQEQLARNREKATRHNTKHDYLLRSLLVCGCCGRRLIGVWSAAGQGRYVCSARYPRTAAWACSGRSVSAARVEAQVWDYVHGLLADKDLLRTRYEESRGDPAVQPREEQERERLERKAEAIGREVQRLIDAYQAGAVELTELQQRRRRSEEQNQVLRRRLAEIQQQRREREQEIRLLEGLEAFCASIQEALVAPSFSTKQKMLELVLDCIVVEETKLTIRHIVPTGPVRLRTEPHPTENLR
jgi:site-specific DNA recombinase